jgi:hypothetical protein
VHVFLVKPGPNASVCVLGSVEAIARDFLVLSCTLIKIIIWFGVFVKKWRLVFIYFWNLFSLMVR